MLQYMGYTYDLFISYSASDDISLHKYQKGWVSNLADTLLNIFEQVFGEKLRMLPNSDKRPSFEQLTETCLFICVLSPEYIKDAHCLEEIKLINQVISYQEKESVRRRILKVVKHPVTREVQPQVIKHLINYNLLSVDFFDTGSNALDHSLELEAKKEFKLQLANLAYDIKELLRQENPARDTVNPGSRIANVAPVLQDAVFLAETGADLLMQRQIIKRELEKQGYRVLPEQKLPSDLIEVEATVRRDLEASKVSIHLIGGSHGEIPKGTDRSIVEIQNKFAAEHNLVLTTGKADLDQDPAFSQFIWVASDLEQLNAKQKDFIEGLKKDAPHPYSTQVLQTPLKDLRMIINDRFTIDPKNNAGGRGIAASQLPEIYFMYDKVDIQHVRPIIDLFQSYGFRLSLPVFEGEILEIRKAHIAKLITFDLAVIYKKQVNEQWLRMKIADLLKAPGYGRKKEIFDKVIITDTNSGTDYPYYTDTGFTIIVNPELYISELIARISATKKNGDA